MSWTDFYADGKLGNTFGVRGPFYGRRGHLGVDFIWRAGTPIPSWTAGVVAVVAAYAALGNTVIIRRADGTHAGFCHMQTKSSLKVGQAVSVGDIVGIVGNTGTSTSGPHLHATLEPTAVIGTLNALDPLPHIRAAVQAANQLQENDMAQGAFFRNESTGYVYWQEKPNTPLTHISAETWAGYREQGNKWATLSAAAVDGLIAKWGQVDSPATGSTGGPLTINLTGTAKP